MPRQNESLDTFEIEAIREYGFALMSPFTIEGHIEAIGRFGRGLRRRYPRAGRFLAGLFLYGFMAGLIRLLPEL